MKVLFARLLLLVVRKAVEYKITHLDEVNRSARHGEAAKKRKAVKAGRR